MRFMKSEAALHLQRKTVNEQQMYMARPVVTDPRLRGDDVSIIGQVARTTLYLIFAFVIRILVPFILLHHIFADLTLRDR